MLKKNPGYCWMLKKKLVAIPVYPAYLTFKVSAIGEMLDPLPLLILQMARDKSTIEDILVVTCLPENIINQEIDSLVAAKLIKENNTQLSITEIGCKALVWYDLAKLFSNLPYRFFISGLDYSLFLYRPELGDIVSESELSAEKISRLYFR